MDEQTKRDEDQQADSQKLIGRRVVLGRGVKLVYVVPAILAAMTASSAFAGSNPT